MAKKQIDQIRELQDRLDKAEKLSKDLLDLIAKLTGITENHVKDLIDFKKIVQETQECHTSDIAWCRREIRSAGWRA